VTDWLTSIEGTSTGHHLALALALFAALTHAIFGALQKGRHGPWLTRGAVDLCYGVMAAPVAFFLVPWPEPHMWIIFAGAFAIHTSYKVLQAMTYSRGAYTVVYPVVRGTGPLVTVLAAGLVFDEIFSPLQWAGLGALLAGIFGLAAYNIRHTPVDRQLLFAALALALITGMMVALYTTFDAYGIRATANPATFLAWFFFFDGISMPLLTGRRLLALSRAEALPLFRRGVLGAVTALMSFGAIMMATRLDKVGEAAVLRETSTLFAALIGWLMLNEVVGRRRLALMALIALGAVIVEMGG